MAHFRLMNPEDYADLDRRHLWHPYTRHSEAETGSFPIITRGEGVYLYDADGRRYLDAISSWWACALGHGHPRVVKAIQNQAAELQHSILGHLSHPRAIELAARLAESMPDPRYHVLFASDGSSAVEAALKIALQYWRNRGESGRTRFISLENAYHGDTIGAVSVGYLDQFHRPFSHVLSPALRAPAPTRSEDHFDAMVSLIKKHSGSVAAVIVEPLCQGAAGMNMYHPDYLTRLADECRRNQLLLIVDEIAMGMGRTGKMFAFEHAGIRPDMVCVGKALSAGYLPISATIVRDEIYRTFSDQPEDHSFYHGHTFCGNPIAAAAAVETLKVYAEDMIVERAARLGRLLEDRLRAAAHLPGVREVRGLGMIGAIELIPEPARAGRPARATRVQERLRVDGVLLRPLGNVLYLMPPLVTPENILEELVEKLITAVKNVP